MEFYYCLSICV